MHSKAILTQPGCKRKGGSAIQRKFIFKAGRRQITLPVSPQSFEVGSGQRVETVAIHQLGDVNLSGGRTLDTISISCLLPARDYPFARDAGDPYAILSTFEGWVEQKKKLRFNISGTEINKEVLLESIRYGERDGTNDVYATLTLREAPTLEAAKTVQPPAASKPRSGGEGNVQEEQSYTAVYGDTLCGICRKYYQDGSYALAQKLAAYNSRPNPNILYVGETLRIPPKSALGG